MRRKEGERKEKHRDKLKFSSLLAELQAADFIVFPTEILNSYPMDDDANDELATALMALAALEAVMGELP